VRSAPNGTVHERRRGTLRGDDDDGDSLVDCDDPDCSGLCGAPAYGVPFEEACANGLDDDADGRTDCQDLDCAGDPSCPP
jgi:hypothetical protein